MYPVRFYVFEDTTNPPNLLSYATLERLGIVQFQVPNLAATHSLDQVAVQTPGGKRKTTKQVTFQDPISEIEGSHTSSNPLDNCHGIRGRPLFSSKGEEALTSSHSKTISTEDAVNSNHFKTTSTTKEVKVGSSIYSRTIPPPKVH